MKELNKTQQGIALIATPFVLGYLYMLVSMTGWRTLVALAVLAITAGCVLYGYKMINEDKQP